MATTPPLKGEAPRSQYIARTGQGVEIDPNEAIFPLVSQLPDGTFRLIGTGFFIASNGIFLTAAHVVEDVLDPSGEAIAPLGLFQFLPGETYKVRPVHMATRHGRSDVAVGVTAPMVHSATGAPFANRCVSLTAAIPQSTQEICTFAYPKTTITAGRPQRVNFAPTYFSGRV